VAHVIAYTYSKIYSNWKIKFREAVSLKTDKFHWSEPHQTTHLKTSNESVIPVTEASVEAWSGAPPP
jgi:hypothetical protein